MEISTVSAAKGRPREFCVDQALAAALRVFWSKGFDGASLTDLTEAMGITRPSLYAAFGNKEELFRKALDLYGREKLAYVQTALAAPTARGVAEWMLKGALDIATSNCDPVGCFGVVSSIGCTAHADSIRDEVIARRSASEAAIIGRFQRARRGRSARQCRAGGSRPLRDGDHAGHVGPGERGRVARRSRATDRHQPAGLAEPLSS
jgi:AcrR family transcriptional regulator